MVDKPENKDSDAAVQSVLYARLGASRGQDGEKQGALTTEGQEVLLREDEF